MTYDFQMNNVSRHNFLGLDLLQLDVAHHGCLECQLLLQFVHDVARLILLQEPDDCIKDKQSADHSKVHPVL